MNRIDPGDIVVIHIEAGAVRIVLFIRILACYQLAVLHHQTDRHPRAHIEHVGIYPGNYLIAF
ncbi:hypothetical protein D3C77_401220 [compost metagenome]